MEMNESVAGREAENSGKAPDCKMRTQFDRSPEFLSSLERVRTPHFQQTTPTMKITKLTLTACAASMMLVACNKETTSSEKMDAGADKVSEGVKEMADAAKATTKENLDKAKPAIERAKENASAAADEAKVQMEAAADEAKAKMEAAAEKAKEAAQDAKDAAAGAIQDAKDKVEAPAPPVEPAAPQ